MMFTGDRDQRVFLGADDADRPPDPTLPIRWHELDDHEYRTALTELDQWVDWLIHRYRRILERGHTESFGHMHEVDGRQDVVIHRVVPSADSVVSWSRETK